jgi:hypothetical protein
VQQRQSLSEQLIAKKAKARDVAGGQVEARDEPLFDRVLTHGEDNGNGFGLRFCRQY